MAVKINFQTKLFLVLGAVVCFSIMSILFIIQETTKRRVHENIKKRFENTQVALRHLQKLRTQFAIDAIDTLTTSNAHFRSVLSTASVPGDGLGFGDNHNEHEILKDLNLRLMSILPFLSLYKKADIFIATNAEGILLFSKAFPGKFGVDLTNIHLFEELSEKPVAVDVWRADMQKEKDFLVLAEESDAVYHMIAKPVVFRDEIHGVVIFGSRIDKDILLRLKNISGVELALYSGDGIHTSTLPVTAEQALTDFMMKSLDDRGKSDIHEIFLDKESYLSRKFPILADVSIEKGSFIALKSLTKEMKFISKLRITFIVMGGVILLIALGLSFFMAKGFTKPLKKLAMAAKSIGAGKLDTRVCIRTGDELETLGDAFNDMVNGLKEKEFIEDIFGKYVDKQVKDEVLSGRLPLDGEQKEVSVLFSDLRNFTVLIEQNDSKKAVKIMNRYFTVMAQAIHRNNGHVLQFIGDEIYAVFGAPVFSKNHCTDAVKAALAMKNKLPALNNEFKKKGWPTLKHGIGVHSGKAVAANIGSPDRMSYLLVGNTVNIAARLQELNKVFKTELIISESTFNKIDLQNIKTLLSKELPPSKLKGLTIPVKLFTCR
jgi:class 3 adenylate cyclase